MDTLFVAEDNGIIKGFMEIRGTEIGKLYVEPCFQSGGDLQAMNDNCEITFKNLKDADDKVKKGDQVVTSYVSDKFLQGILIGYVSETEMDSNNITKSGTITPAADFEHLREVLVILDKKTDATSDTEK